jgi:hypothetical protein
MFVSTFPSHEQQFTVSARAFAVSPPAASSTADASQSFGNSG